MPQITTLLTGAGVTTNVIGNANSDNLITVGDCDTANPLSGLQLEIDGTTFVNIVGAQTLVTAFGKWLNQISASALSTAFKLGTGAIQRSTNYRFTNAGATTPIIYATSDADNGVPVVAGTKQVNPLSNENFKRFSALMIQTPANVTQVDFLFRNKKKQIFSIQEVDAMYALKRPTEADGRLGGVSVIDNTDQSIEEVRIYASTAVVILIVKLPDASFELMKAAAEELQLG